MVATTSGIGGGGIGGSNSSSPLEKLLQRLSRQFSSHVSRPRPPDSAAASLGREIGRQLQSGTTTTTTTTTATGAAARSSSSPGQQQNINSSSSNDEHEVSVLFRAFVRAANGGMPPCVPHSFFDVIRGRMLGDLTGLSSYDDWVPRWIVQTEEAILHGSRQQEQHRGVSSSATEFFDPNSSGLRHLLDASIRAYAYYLVIHQQSLLLNDEGDDDGGGDGADPAHRNSNLRQQLHRVQQSTLDVYRRLRFGSSRQYLLRSVLNSSFREQPELLGWTVPIVLSPFLVVSVLPVAPSSSSDSKSAALTLFWRHVWTAWTSPSVAGDDCHALLDWATTALSIHLDVYTAAAAIATTATATTTDEEDPDSSMSAVASAMGLAESWFVELCFLVQALHRRQQQQQLQPQQDEQQTPALLDEWVEGILYGTVPRILGVCSYHDQTPLLQGLMDVLSLSSASSLRRQGGLTTAAAAPAAGGGRLDASAALRLATLTLMAADPNDRVNLLLLLRHDDGTTMRPKNRVALSLLRSVACICIQGDEESCREAALKLNEKLCNYDTTSMIIDETLNSPTRTRTNNLMRLLEREVTGGDNNNNKCRSLLVDGIATLCDFRNAKLSAPQQIAALLFGIFLLDHDDVTGGGGRNDDDDDDNNRGARFLSNLLTNAPHLGISLLPIVMDRINRASKSADGQRLLRYLEFLCTALARDPHCAQELWFWMGGKLMQADVPMSVRVTVIRLFPKLCDTNRRLYRRVIESLETAVTHRQPEIRLAVAATLADLAKNDQIRDVSDVIGWIQGLLTEERLTPVHSLLVHCAISSLHYLVVAQELDFDVVVKVLNKRLCSIADFEAVADLPSVIQEALVLLLGDGESDSSSDDDEGGGPAVHTVSPQVSSAVRTLLRLGSSLLERSKLDANQSKTLENIFTSLSGYSVEALGLTEEGVQAVISGSDSVDKPPALPEAGEKYAALRDLVIRGMKISLGNKQTKDDPRVRLARKMLEFEEESIGASLWRKHGSRGQSKPNASRTAKETQSSLLILPDPSEVQGLTAARPSPSSAIAMLLSCDGSNLQTIRDNGDAALESSEDPLFTLFILQAYLHAGASVVAKTARETMGSMLVEVRSWHMFVSPDTMYLTLCGISVYLPHDLGDKSTPNTTFVEDIFKVVMEAFKSNRFENDVIGKICLSLAAVSTIRAGSIEHTVETVNTLEQSVKAYGGQQCFGAYYGLGMVCQALQYFIDSDILEPVIEEVRKTIFRICSFLVEELLSCYEERSDIFVPLVACLKTGFATADLVDSMSDLDMSSVALLMTKHVTARCLFLSCALCLPGVAVLNGALHLATLRLLEAFEWGGGKGIVLPPMLRACKDAHLFEDEELKQIYTSFTDTFEDRMDDDDVGVDSEGLDDIFYALNGTLTKPSSHLIRRTLVGNKDLFDEDGCVLSLVATVMAVVKLPCLCGAPYFALQPELRIEAEKNDVKSVVGIVREAVMTGGGGSKFSSMGMILLALLASMKNQQELITDTSQQTISGVTSPKKREEERSALNFEKIPNPRPGTVLAGLLQEVEVQAEATASSKGQIYLTRALSSLECLSLPDHLAKSFLEPLMQLTKGPTALACVSLLCSQVRGRRRAVFDGSEFVRSALSLSNMDPEQWDRICGDTRSLKIFVASLPEMMKKLPPESSELALENVWCSCLAALGNDSSLVVSFLASARQLVGNATLSPTTIKAIRHVIERASKDLPEFPLFMLTNKPNEGSPSILESYTACLREMPREIIDEDDYVNILKSLEGFDSEVVKALSLTALIDSGYFSSSEREGVEVSRIATWISKKLQLSSKQVDQWALRQVLVSFAAVTTKESSATKRGRLSSLLEVLLLTKKATSRLGFEWLAVVTAHWCEGHGSDAELTLGFLCVGATGVAQTLPAKDLEDYFHVLLEDLPYNLALFSSQPKMSATVSNQLHRLYALWSEQNVDNDILECIRKTIFACQSGLLSIDDPTFASLASSTLSAQPFISNNDSSSLTETGMSDLEIRTD